MFKSEELDIFVYWINERENIRAFKVAGYPKPWTNDPLLRDYRWCNVRRMDDRVSQWLAQNWYPEARNPQEQLLLATLGRLINWPDSLAELKNGGWRNHEYVLDTLSKRFHSGEKTFTGAYIVPGVPGMSKVCSVYNTAHAVIKQAPSVLHWRTMCETWCKLLDFDGIGRFLAGQIVADLAHMPHGETWTDRDYWAPCGPGSARGLNRLRGYPKDQSVPQDEFIRELGALSAIVKPRVADVWESRKLQAMDVQNCLCEFDKYRRLTLGEGKVRSRYDGRA